MTYDHDRPDAHKPKPAKPVPIYWIKDNPYAIKSSDGRYIIGKYIVLGKPTYTLWVGAKRHGLYMSSDDARKAAVDHSGSL